MRYCMHSIEKTKIFEDCRKEFQRSLCIALKITLRRENKQFTFVKCFLENAKQITKVFSLRATRAVQGGQLHSCRVWREQVVWQFSVIPTVGIVCKKLNSLISEDTAQQQDAVPIFFSLEVKAYVHADRYTGDP